MPVAVEDDSRLAAVAGVFEGRAEVVDQLAVIFEAPHADRGVVEAPGRCP